MNACRVCVVEVEGSRVLVPVLLAQGRGRHGDPDRLRARPPSAASWCSSCSAPRSTCRPPPRRRRAGWREYGAEPGALRPAGAAGRGGRARPRPGRPPPSPATGQTAATVAQPVKVDNELYVRDYCEVHPLLQVRRGAAAPTAQNTFAIAVAGRGFDARISTEFAVPLPGLGLRLLRQLHRRLPDRRADVQERARPRAPPAPGTSRTRRRPTRSAPTAASAAR